MIFCDPHGGWIAYLSERIGFAVFTWNTCITLSAPQITNLESSIHATSRQLAAFTVRSSLLYRNGRCSYHCQQDTVSLAFCWQCSITESSG